MSHGKISPITHTSQGSFRLFSWVARSRAASWKLLKQVFWKYSMLLLGPMAFSKEWQYLQIKYLFKHLYAFSLQNLCLLGLSARTLNPSYKIRRTFPTLQRQNLLWMNRHLFFALICLEVLDLVLATVICNFDFWTGLLQCRLHGPILSFHTRNHTCCIVLLFCPGKRSKQNDTILSPLCCWVRLRMSIKMHRTCSVWLSWICMLSQPLKPNELSELAVYRFTFLEHTELSERKVSHCPDAIGGWQGNNASLVLWKKRSRL